MGLIKAVRHFVGRNVTTTVLLVLVLSIDALISLIMVLFSPSKSSSDFETYMQQVRMVTEEGQFDYAKFNSASGAYPAGFVGVYAFFSWLFDWNHTPPMTSTDSISKVISTDDQRMDHSIAQVFVVQLTFLLLYLLSMYLIVKIYTMKDQNRPPTAVILLLCCSRRIHAIWLLGFYNDAIAMLFLYFSIFLFVTDRWNAGCVAFSVAVSVNPHIVLFAPGLLCLLLLRFGVILTFFKIILCFMVQIVLGVPFLLVNPYSYLSRAFDITRLFTLETSVNYRFLPETVFSSPLLYVSLAICCIVVWVSFAFGRWWSEGLIAQESLLEEKQTATLSPETAQEMRPRTVAQESLCLPPSFVTYVLFSSNFLGIVFARSLQYQHYVYYFHTLPFLLWRTSLSTFFKILLLVALEVAWNVQPSLPLSASIIQIVHIAILSAMCLLPVLAVPKRMNE
eukprot:TRINITY_DN3381_c0_g1_i1.p1 TRINITY_DN3381_c0_g1~~TRINITY_DN3381_c0_g1_i1.p1  ORF type:complete len:450 (+),score=48.78 TRINITY_DN3381_c0_g1_i1:99-1448(+)